MPLVNLGKIEITPSASQALSANNLQPTTILNHHQHGDQGTDSSFELAENFVLPDRSIASKFKLKDETELWVVTAEDYSQTRVFLDEEFQKIEVDVQEGYAIWSESYDTENNA